MKKHPLLSLVGLCIGVLIFFPIMWGDRDDVLWQFVYNFQTLITGIFAILAALLTVAKMHEVDAGQQARHDELIALSLRRDKLIVQRALQPQVPELKRLAVQLAEQVACLFSVEDEGVEYYFTGSEWREFLIVVDYISEVIKRKQIEEVQPLLSPSGFTAYQEILIFCDVIDKTRTNVIERLRHRRPLNQVFSELKGVLEYRVEGINIFTQAIVDLDHAYSK